MGLNGPPILVDQAWARGGQLFASRVSSVDGVFGPTIQKNQAPLCLRTAIAIWTRQGVSSECFSYIATRGSRFNRNGLGYSIGNTIWLGDDDADWWWIINARPNLSDECPDDGLIWVAKYADVFKHIDLLKVMVHEPSHIRVGLGERHRLEPHERHVRSLCSSISSLLMLIFFKSISGNVFSCI